MIIGCIWGFCVVNLVFVFMIFISKITKNSIREIEDQNAKIYKKYPFMFWCDYILLAIFLSSLWIYYLEYSQSANWLLTFAKNHGKSFSIIGTLIIIGGFIALAIILYCKNLKIKNNTYIYVKKDTPSGVSFCVSAYGSGWIGEAKARSFVR